MSRVRRVAVVLTALLICCASSFGVTFSSPASAAVARTDSSITESGKAEFSSLRVSVAQTRNLMDQVVEVSWKGGVATTPGAGQYGVNYLQIMQCWGDDPKGPSREQCQFGSYSGDPRGGGQTGTRQVTSDVVDPKETIKQKPGDFAPAFVPFRSYDGEVAKTGPGELFSAATSNEVPYAQTRADGTGQDFFSMQTVVDAPALGCGEPVVKAGKRTGRSCWLVVVPRSNLEVDGQPTRATDGRLITSPLSASNWAKRIVFPLQFSPIGDPCPIGGAERKTTGQENVAEAMLRWQPVLCSGGGSVYGYSQVGDDAARRELKTNDPGLVYLSDPLSAAENPDRRKVLYAPVALSGLTVAFNVESQAPGSAPKELKAKNGQRIDKLRLTPRLVAKLITQTYTRAADVDSPAVAGNPTNLTKDEEFLKLNPQFDGLSVNLPDLLLPLGRADSIRQVWTWLKADKDAAAFLAGVPDPWGTKINSSFRGMTVPRADYPKSDKYCRTYPPPVDPQAPQQPPLCTLDQHPYANDMHDAARSAAYGDTLARLNWDPNAAPPSYKKGAAQPSGERALLALVDTASAQRYGLETAELRNGAGAFVAPTNAALQAAAAEMKPGPAGVRVPAATVKSATAYPLATLSYAATAPAVLEPAARTDYAKLLRYAAGKGQVPGIEPGDLPYGYAPLPAALRKQTRAAASALIAANKVTDTDGDGESDPAPGTGTGTDGASPPAGADGGATDGTPAANALTDPGGTALVSLSTPVDPTGLGRLVPFAALALGVLAACAGPVLLRLARRGSAVPPTA